MRFVVIGGDAAGMSAASKAKRNNPDLEVIVLEQSEDVSYSACGMPYNIADPDREMNDLVVRTAAVFRGKQGIDLRTGHKVDRIDRQNKTVSGTDAHSNRFQIAYDKLLIATGSRPKMLPIPGIDLPGVKVLRSLEDGRRIKSYIDSHNVRSAVIIGGGYIGLEMVEALCERGMHVQLVEIRDSFLPWLPKAMDDLIRTELETHEVKVKLETSVTRIESHHDRLKIFYSDSETVVDLVVLAVGVVPNSELAADAGLVLGPGFSIAVDRYLRTSDPDIYAVGDCADAFHQVTGQRVWIPLALRANRGGWAVADNITGRASDIPDIVGTAVFKVLDLEVARTGLSFEEALNAGFDPVENIIQSSSRAHAHPGATTIHVHLVADKKTGRLLGASMIGKEGAAHRINALAVALHASMTVREFFGCDLAYAPPFSPVWDPMLTAANQLLKKL
ncbi:FAD-dependent oxidoreductase [Desulfomonile tiedjei]|uniref:NAD(FAD)-dependent dehydrogenase n=1 Tax=Desulfomonile tiedjei (strain ATCC 49306 / DSM 6799 / DCB-1) TaxID=706587 RepID=I4C3K0_DESTA|nr:FAD-dependent oxidoreductase [Desulfomonile tiedjei]AFM24141.1 NAD(FAD)-dependent dehydrogenase [Desulfomonile tiedjei DSM 6799]